jgi:NitT/TauT family transport system substrate-binding protein
MPTIDLSNLPFAAGLWQGYLREEGLEIELLRIGGQAALPALLNGEVSYLFGWGAASGGIVQGVPMKVLAILLDRPLHVIVVQPWVSGLADLRGRRVGVSRAGSSDELLIERALHTAGLRLDEVELVRLGETSARFGALAAGQVDAATLIQPYTAEAERQGLQVLARGSDLLQLPIGIIATTQAHLDARPEQVRGLLRAVARSLTYLHAPANRAELVARATAYFQLDPALAPVLVEEMLRTVTPDGEAPEAVLAAALDEARAQVGRRDPIPLHEVIDFSLLRQARREVGGP